MLAAALPSYVPQVRPHSARIETFLPLPQKMNAVISDGLAISLPLNPTSDLTEMIPDSRAQIGDLALIATAVATYWSIEDSFLQHQKGLLDVASWATEVATLKSFLFLPAWRGVGDCVGTSRAANIVSISISCYEE